MHLKLEAYGPEAGNAFVEAMEQSAAQGHSHFTSPKEAASFHSQNIASNAIRLQADSQFGEGGRSYIQAVAANSDDPNLLDLGKANKAMTDLGKAQSALGANFQNVFGEALKNHSDNGERMSSHIASEYNKVKQEKKDAEPPQVPVNDQA